MKAANLNPRLSMGPAFLTIRQHFRESSSRVKDDPFYRASLPSMGGLRPSLNILRRRAAAQILVVSGLDPANRGSQSKRSGPLRAHSSTLCRDSNSSGVVQSLLRLLLP